MVRSPFHFATLFSPFLRSLFAKIDSNLLFLLFRRNYFAQWSVVLPLEITAAGITVQYWDRAAAVPIGVWITVFWFGSLALSFAKARTNS